MNILAIHGSPRQSGGSVLLAEDVITQSGGEVTRFYPYHDDIRACIDCGYCAAHTGTCAVQDAMQDIYRCLDTCDVVVLSSPIYFGLPTPPMLGVLSRFQAYFSQEYGKLPACGPEKKGVLVVTGGGSGGFHSTETTLGTMLKVMNSSRLATISSLCTDALPADEDPAARVEAVRVGNLLKASV